eukprot:NODE_313_length_1492_cov_134.853084_g226_i0.p1 GENE.NODE_313_length_1492_cov_134.853084_g226_i0~~NODE_313_length_1492_cov_134.853084_g226_i0.p1  ORF type:complete len:454 (+),score=99.24 NODE_313_length_1492_cov_134.853084_g226_i0:80-1441(+)
MRRRDGYLSWLLIGLIALPLGTWYWLASPPPVDWATPAEHDEPAPQAESYADAPDVASQCYLRRVPLTMFHSKLKIYTRPRVLLARAKSERSPDGCQHSRWYVLLEGVCLSGSSENKVVHIFGARAPSNWKDATPPALFGVARGPSPLTASTWSAFAAGRPMYYFAGTSYYLPNQYNIAHDLADSFIVLYDLLHTHRPDLAGGRLVLHPALPPTAWLVELAETMLHPTATVHDPAAKDHLACFQRLVLCGKDRHYSSSSGLLARFRGHALAAVDLPDNRPNRAGGVRMLFYTRAHEARRRILNPEQVEAALRAIADRFPNTRLEVHHRYVPGFRAQVRQYHETDILIGVTGGSQTNTVFMGHASAAVVELLPCNPAGVSWLHFLGLWSVKRGNHLPLLNCPSAPEPTCTQHFTERKCLNPRNYNFNVTAASLQQMETFISRHLTSLHKLAAAR